MKIKVLIWVVLFFAIAANMYAIEKLGMFIEVKRYLDEMNNTKYVIDYQVPYKNLIFQSRDNGYFAELKVKLSIANQDSVIYSKDFINNIGVTRKYDITSQGKSFLDRMAITLAKSNYLLNAIFEDINSGKSYEWKYQTEQLDPDSMLSDLELITSIIPDSVIYSQKFNRNGKTYIPEVSGILSLGSTDSIYIYCEIQNIKDISDKAVLTLKRDQTIVLIANQTIKNAISKNQLLFPINLSNLETGKYYAYLSVTSADKTEGRSLEFIVTETAQKYYFIFTNMDEEYQLIRDFATTKSSSEWKSMSPETKRRYISNFWLYMAEKSNEPVDEILNFYKERIDYSNTHFSHFEKGWKTDMGRIYIRNGRPDDIESDTSSDDTRFVRKDYQIWKYSGSIRAVYVFVDVQMNGNYKLIYVDNDDMESTNPQWKSYLGSDFDESRLEN